MHYRTPRVNFLDTADTFLERFRVVRRLDTPSFDTSALAGCHVPLAVVPAAP